MYSLPIVVAGCNDDVLSQVRRELLNQETEVEAEFRQIKDLLPRCNDFRSEPRLFVVHLQSPQHLSELRTLSSTLIGQPILALVDKGAGTAELIDAMRAGAAQVVILPLDAADFRSALQCIGLQCGQPAAASRLIAVSGVTGGCGATTLAINLAYEMAHSAERQAILTELSLQMGMLVAYLDFEPTYTIEDLIGYSPQIDVRLVENALTKVTDRVRVLAGPEHPIAMTADVLERIRLILSYLRNLGEVVVMDVPCTFGDPYFDLLATAEEVVLVSEQRIPAIRNVQLVLRALANRGASSRCHLVLNRYDPEIEGFTTRDIEKLLNLPRVLTVANDPVQINAALNQGQSLRMACPRSRALADIESLTQTLLGLDRLPGARPAAPTMFGRLFQAIGLT